MLYIPTYIVSINTTEGNINVLIYEMILNWLDILVITHWGQDKMAAIFADIFICIFLNENFGISNKMSLKYVP